MQESTELSQSQKLTNKMKSLGIKYLKETMGSLTLFGMGEERTNALSIGIDSNPREGIKDAAIVFCKDGDIQPVEQIDSQYVIDNFETIYNASGI